MKPDVDNDLSIGSASGPKDAPAHLTLDERIALAEQRVLARDERLYSGLQALRRRARQVLEPRRLLWPAMGVAALLLASLSLLRRPRTADVAADTSTSARADDYSPLAVDGPWMRGGLLLWPLLPERWRAQVSPALATALVAIGLPLLRRLLKRRPRVRRPG